MLNDPPIQAQYRAATSVGGLCTRENRGLIHVSGADCGAWLNNLVTNSIKTVRPGEGRYAFACDVRGRIIADLNALATGGGFWLDLDRRWMKTVVAHLNRHVITEDVTLADVSSRICRLAVLGPRAGDAVLRMGFGDLAGMGQLQHVEKRSGNAEIRMIRHDFAGLPAAEFVILAAEGSSAEPDDEPLAAAGEGSRGGGVREEIAAVCGELGMAELERPVVEVLRIEAGIPASVEDIDEDVLPSETGQTERGIDYRKGCYLGQEIIERMRSRGALARRLVGLRIDGEMPVAPQSFIRVGEAQVGRTRSCCWSQALGAVLALGYVKIAHADPGVEVMVDTISGQRRGTVIELPVQARIADAG
jgi:tRNA-modifying protein YgfZ